MNAVAFAASIVSGDQPRPGGLRVRGAQVENAGDRVEGRRGGGSRLGCRGASMVTGAAVEATPAGAKSRAREDLRPAESRPLSGIYLRRCRPTRANL
jgi:hypothetical protein